MHSTKTQHTWEAFLRFYSGQYRGRKTRLGIFEKREDVTNDYWIESGLPLLGIDIDLSGEKPAIEVLLDGYSHSVQDAKELNAHFSVDSDEDGIDISHPNGSTTILRFEKP